MSFSSLLRERAMKSWQRDKGVDVMNEKSNSNCLKQHVSLKLKKKKNHDVIFKFVKSLCAMKRYHFSLHNVVLKSECLK